MVIITFKSNIILKVTKFIGTLNLVILVFLVVSLNLVHAKPVNA